MCQDANPMYEQDEDRAQCRADVREAERDELVNEQIQHIWSNDGDLQEAMIQAIEEDEGNWIKQFGAEMAGKESHTAALTMLTNIVMSVKESAEMQVGEE